MPAKKSKKSVGGRKVKVGGRKRKAGGRKMMAGAGFWSSIGNAFRSAGNFVKDQAVKAAPAIVNAVKSSGAVGNLVSRVNPTAGAVVKAAGLGRRRRMGGRGAVTSESVKVMAF